MNDLWETLGSIEITFRGHLIEIELLLGSGNFRLDVDVYEDGERLSDGTVSTFCKVRPDMEYVGNPSLVDRICGRARKKQVGTNIEEFIQNEVDSLVEGMFLREKMNGNEPDRDAIQQEFEEQIFPLEGWADGLEDITAEEPDISVPFRRGF